MGTKAQGRKVSKHKDDFGMTTSTLAPLPRRLLRAVSPARFAAANPGDPLLALPAPFCAEIGVRVRSLDAVAALLAAVLRSLWAEAWHMGTVSAHAVLADAEADWGEWEPGSAEAAGDIDGLRIDWSDGFGLVRASNTTPVLVLRFEGHTPEALARIQSDMMHMLRQVKPDAQVQEAAH